MKILVADVTILTPDRVIEKGFAFIDGATMVLGEGEPEEDHQYADMVLGGEGYVALPGFINTLVFPEAYALRSIIENSFKPNKRLLQYLARMEYEEAYYSSIMGFAELAYDGYTGVVAIAVNAEASAKALRDSGLYGAVLVPIDCPGINIPDWTRVVEEMPGGERVIPGIVICSDTSTSIVDKLKERLDRFIAYQVVSDTIVVVEPESMKNTHITPLWIASRARLVGTGTMHLNTPWPFLAKPLKGEPLFSSLVEGWQLFGIDGKSSSNLIVIDAGEPPSMLVTRRGLAEIVSSKPRIETVISMGTVVVDGGQHMFIGRSTASKAREVLSRLTEKYGV